MKGLCSVLVVLSIVWGEGARCDDAFLKALQEELEKRGNPWVAGKTSVSDLPLEVKRKMVGKVPIISANKVAVRKSMLTLPESWDWRSKDGKCWMTKIRDQSFNCGSCWCFGPVAMLEARWNIWNNKPQNDVNLSEAFIIACNPHGWVCWDGHETFWDWVKHIKGIPEEACFRYGEHEWHMNCMNKCAEWRASKAPYEIVNHGFAFGTDGIKNEIMRGPVSIWMTIKEDFFYYTGGVYEPIMGDDLGSKGGTRRNHIVCCVGWTSDGKWIYKNSWGTGWGESDGGCWGERGYGKTGENMEYAVWCDPISYINKPRIVLENVEFIETNNMVWEPGEEVQLIITLKNTGIDATNVQAILTTTSSYITINTDLYSFGNMPQWNVANNSSTPFLAIASNPPSLPYKIPFNLRVTASESSYVTDITFDGWIGSPRCQVLRSLYNVGWLSYATTFDGTHLWVAGWSDPSAAAPFIYKVTPDDGLRVGRIPTPQNDIKLTGIAYDWVNNCLWVHSLTHKKIFKLNLNGNILKSFPSPATQYPTGLAFDGTHLWAVDRDKHKIFQLTTSGTTVSSWTVPIPQPSAGPYGPRDLAFESNPAAPDGGTLVLYYTWFSAPEKPDSTIIYEITRNGTLTGNKCKTPGSGTIGGRLVGIDSKKGVYWVDGGAEGPIYEITGFYSPVVGVEEKAPQPRVTQLVISPNPSKNGTSVRFYLFEREKISVSIYDISGKFITRLVDKEFEAGTHTLTWNGNDLSDKRVATGVYFCRVETHSLATTKKFIILR